jgi:hypothetical protein
LPGPKGVFNGRALAGDTVIIAEGGFDALSLVAAGYDNACASFGVSFRWDWVRANRVVFAFDQDAGGAAWRDLAWEGVLRGKTVFWLPAEVYGGFKDLNEVWIATRRVDLGAWPDGVS